MEKLLPTLDFTHLNDCTNGMEYVTGANKVIAEALKAIEPFDPLEIGRLFKRFKVEFPLDRKESVSIDLWINFVQNHNFDLLVLNFTGLDDMKENYEFPSEKTLPNVGTLAFNCVNISDKTLESLVRSPSLQFVNISAAGLLSRVIVRDNFGLRLLELESCPEIKLVDIHDSTLEFFRFFREDADIDFSFNDLPCIRLVDIGKVTLGKDSKVLQAISCVASNLEVLSLDVNRTKEDIYYKGIPCLPKVEVLTLTVPTKDGDSLFPILEIANKCTKLFSFTLWLHWEADITENEDEVSPSDDSDDDYEYDFSELMLLNIHGFRAQESVYDMIAFILLNRLRPDIERVLIDTKSHRYDTPRASNAEDILAIKKKDIWEMCRLTDEKLVVW